MRTLLGEPGGRGLAAALRSKTGSGGATEGSVQAEGAEIDKAKGLTEAESAADHVFFSKVGAGLGPPFQRSTARASRTSPPRAIEDDRCTLHLYAI